MDHKTSMWDSWPIKDLLQGINHALEYIENGIAYDSDLYFIDSARKEYSRRIDSDNNPTIRGQWYGQ